MTEKEQELTDEILRLTGQVAAARVSLALIFRILSKGAGPDGGDLVRTLIGESTFISGGGLEDELRREGFDHFKNGVLEILLNKES